VVRFAVFLFDVDKQPVRSTGIVGAAVLIGCYGLYTMAAGGYAAAWLTSSGEVYAAKQDYDKAIDDYDVAIRLDPKSAMTFDYRGRAYAAKQDYDRATADYKEAIRLDPWYVNNTFIITSWAYVAKQDYDRAIAAYNEAIRLDPNLPLPSNYAASPMAPSGTTTAPSPT
jgi:tetratricopeptide (TPR) repeat protein